MDTAGFVTSLVTSFVVFLLLLALHAFLSRFPSNSVIYYPRKILNGTAPPARSSGALAWIKEAYFTTDDEIVRQAGLDAAIYMTFLSSALSICLYTAFFSLPVLLPVSGTDHNFQSGSQSSAANETSNSSFDKVAMGNVRDESKRLWAFAVGAYWLTIATFYVLWNSYRHVILLRTHDQSSPTAKPEQYAVLVRDVPSPLTGSIAQEVEDYFRNLHPGDYGSSIIVTNMSKVSKIWEKMEGFRKKQAHAEAIYEETKSRPTHRTGILGLCGPRVDSIDYYKEEKEKQAASLKDEQSVARSKLQKGSAIVFFTNRAAATNAGQVMHSPFANQWTTSPAPEPREVVWKNLPIPFVQRLIRQFAVYTAVFLLICFYMIPISIISAIISLDNLKNKLSFLKPVVNIPVVNAVLQAYLPQLVLIIFLFLLPSILLKLSEIEGIPAQSHLVRAAAGKYFYFNVFNVFLGVTLAGTLFNSLKGIVDDPKSIVDLLSESLPGQATFFISFVALRFFVGYGLTLSRIVPLIIFHLKKRFLCKTEEELKDAWAPGSFDYATCVPSDMLILTITICYSVIAPTILIFAIIYFSLGWLLMRHQALNVVVPSYESGGRMWPHMHSRILASLFLSQLTMLGYFGVKRFVYAPLLFPPLVATVVFAYLCKKWFYPSFVVLPLSASRKEVKEPPSIESILEAYTPPPLRAPNVDEEVSSKQHQPEA